MLGEGARTEHDAERYLASYANAINAIARGQVAASPETADGISIKLSALFSRYEDGQRERVFAELLPRVWSLIEQAAHANLNLTIDAEETDRLELSLDVLDALAARIAAAFPKWTGFGLAVQAYQTRALQVVDAVADDRAHATSCASWCAWSRARIGTARSSARRKAASPATRCSRTRNTPTSRTWPARAR